MGKQILGTFLLIVLIFIVPLIPNPKVIFHWPILISALIGVLLNLSHPPAFQKDLSTKAPRDRYSLLFIFISGCLVFLLPLLDFAYGRKARPMLLSFWSIYAITLSLGGLLFRIWSIQTLGKFFTPRVEIRKDHLLINTGPYQYIRHPSYFGAFAMAIGISLLYRSYIGILFCFLVFFPVYIYRIHLEEKALTAQLGEIYENYKKKTWKMFPWIY